MLLDLETSGKDYRQVKKIDVKIVFGMSESETVAPQQKQQQQFQQQLGAGPMANMAWQYPAGNMHLYPPYAG